MSEVVCFCACLVSGEKHVAEYRAALDELCRHLQLPDSTAAAARRLMSVLYSLNVVEVSFISSCAPCGLRGCKNGPAPFPGRMSYKATKPGLVCLSYLSMLYYCIVVYWGPFLCIVSFCCCVFCLLVVLVKLSLLAK